MRPYTLIFLALFSLQWTLAQQETKAPKVGEIFILGSYNGLEYDYVHFPKLNIVLKRGGIGNWTSLAGTKVVVKEKYQNGNGETFTVLARADGRRFLKVIPSVTSSFERALETGELKRI
ncbi:MAG: hypothetical protein ABF293_05055 [Flavobacteriaceae bacterium]